MFTLGIDSSTQSIKALVYDSVARKAVTTVSVNFGKECPQYASPDGFLPDPDPSIRRANPLMWLDAMELLFAKLQKSFDTSRISAICGDGQQHGSVYLAGDWLERLANGSGTLAERVKGGLSRKTSPIWMDTSTSSECADLGVRFGERLRRDTGSGAIERFTGPQIMRFARIEPEAWAATARVHLVSSFLASVLAFADAPIDTGDGAGMNLLNLRTLEWDREICDFTAPGLLGKLPAIHKPGDATHLKLAKYFEKFGFRANIPVLPWTGDNPASLVGTGADKPGVAVVSLGTSDTFFAAMDAFKTDPDGCGHVFGNPSGGFMSLACVKNGSLAREKVRRETGADYRFFDETAFELTESGNGGRRAFGYFEEEITPRHAATGIEANFDWAAAPAEVKIRALVEGQIANLRDRTRWIGDFDVVRVTGGASRSRGIRETIGAVFGAKVETLDVPDSAALGGAILAARALQAHSSIV